MAKQPDDRDPQHKRADQEPTPPLPIKDVHEAKTVDEVMDADIEAVDTESGPRTSPRASSQPTRIAPYQMDEPAVVEPAPAAAKPAETAFAGMPNLSLEGPQQAAHDVAGENVLADEPVLAQSASAASSAIEVAEVAEEASDVQNVIAGESGHGPRSSSIVEVAELAEVVDDASAHVLDEKLNQGSSVVSANVLLVDSDIVPSGVVELASGAAKDASASDVVMNAEEVVAQTVPVSPPLSEVKPAPATPPTPMGDDQFVTDFLDMPGDQDQGASSIFGSSIGGEPKPAASDSEHAPAVPEEVAQTPTPTKPMASEVEDDAVDLGSDPDVQVDAPGRERSARHEEIEPAAALEDHVTEEIDWDDIGALGDSKVAKKADDDDQATAFEPGSDSAATKRAAAHDVVVWEEDLVDENKPLSGVEPVAREYESGVHPVDEGQAATRGKKAMEEDEVSFDDVDDAFEEPPTRKSDAAERDEDATEMIDKDQSGAAGEVAASADAEDLAASALLDDEEPPAARKPAAAPAVPKGFAFQEDTGAESAREKGDDEEEPGAKKKKSKKKDAAREEELVGAGTRPRQGRRMLAGMATATLVLGVAAAGVWYVKPDLLEQAYKASPNSTYAPPKKEKAKVDSPLIQARARMDNKEFDEALLILKDADKTPANLSTRAEARWLKYLQARITAKEPLDKDASEVKLVQEDLREADNKLLLEQVTWTLNASALKDRAAQAEAAKMDAEKLFSGIAETLAKEKLVDGKGKVDPAVVQKFLKDLGASKTGLAAVNKLLEDAKIKDAGDKGVANLLTAKKDVEDRLDAVNKLLAQEKVSADGANGVAEMIAARNKLAETVKIASQKAESPLAIPLVQLANSLSGLGTGAGKVVVKGFDMAAMAAELAFYRLREPLMVSPDRKMDMYIALFQSAGRKGPAELSTAAREAASLLSKEAQAAPEARAKALYVLGLADRDQANFDAARKNLTDALKAGAGLKNAPWMKLAASSLKELTEAAAYFVPRAEALAAAGNLPEAQEMLNLGLKALPANPRLLALRGLVRLESAQSKRSLMEAAPAIRQDAAAAARNADATSDAAYVLGLLEERLGNFARAEEEYRRALNAHRGNPDDASRYMIALARMLQRGRATGFAPAIPTGEGPAQPKKDEVDPKDDRLAPKEISFQKDNARPETLRGLLTLALVGAAAPDEDDDEDPANAGRIQESMDLANKLMQSANPKIKGQGYLILGQALSKKGRRTEGLREYAKGLELLFPGAPSKDLAKLLEEHPAFQQADAGRPNPALAEQYFAKGMDLFWFRRYAEAGTQFKQAAQLNNQDARYQYFLGMCLLIQNGTLGRDAASAFERGARLEAANRPSMGEVNASLERIQGPLRAYVNTFREKARTAAN